MILLAVRATFLTVGFVYQVEADSVTPIAPPSAYDSATKVTTARQVESKVPGGIIKLTYEDTKTVSCNGKGYLACQEGEIVSVLKSSEVIETTPEVTLPTPTEPDKPTEPETPSTPTNS